MGEAFKMCKVWEVCKVCMKCAKANPTPLTVENALTAPPSSAFSSSITSSGITDGLWW